MSKREVALGRQGSTQALGDEEYHLVLEYKIGGPLTYVSASTHCKRSVGGGPRGGPCAQQGDGVGDGVKCVTS